MTASTGESNRDNAEVGTPPPPAGLAPPAMPARDAGEALPARYHSLYRLWFAFGIRAFCAVLAIVWLMLTKPVI